MLLQMQNQQREQSVSSSGRQRLLYQLAGVVPSPLLLELLSCPLCARCLETLELEMGDLEGGRGEADGLHEVSTD